MRFILIMSKKQKKILVRIIVSACLLIVAAAIPVDGFFKTAAFLIPYFVIGYDILKKAVKGVINLQPFDENFLMAVATVGAMILGEYAEGVAVMLFYQTGELFQSYAVGKSRKSISELMDIRPDYANVENDDGELITVDPETVEPGTVITVKPGEKVPIDGVVESGSSSLDTAALTGESVPIDVTCGDAVTSGCINLSGVLKIRTTKMFGESAVSKILDLVENASSRKSRSENFISRFARVYTPAVCIGALALAILPPVIRALFLGASPDAGVWIYRALTFLVISCPCALVISIPLSFFAGIGGAGNSGILIKGSNYLEALAGTKYVVFDKTGTMTKGTFEVTDIVSNCGEKLIEYAALAESYSSHPISRSVVSAFGRELDSSRVTDVFEKSGYGVAAIIDGKKILVGNGKLMAEHGIEFNQPDGAFTVVHVACDGEYCGHILVADKLKPDAVRAVREIRNAGVKKTVMLTGDLKETGEAVAGELGIDEVYTNLLPGDKVSIVENLISEKGCREKLVFAGDGINDAPVLSRADIGIAMGALGSDAAIEAADVVLMDDNPLKIAKAIRIAKKCMGIVYQNIYFAIGIKLLCLVLGAFGVANMWIAIFADVGVMVLAVINAVRCLYVRNV